MRIIAGRFRRRTLLTNPGVVTRPITDRVKESLFQRIENLLENSRVADIFSGTGTMGLESLSRGARSVVFIEQDRRAFELLQQNVAKLGVEKDVLCWQTDALRSSYRPRGCPELVPFDFVFFDPPYRFVEEAAKARTLHVCLKRLASDSVSSPEARLVLRTPEHSEFELPESWQPEWELMRSGMRIVAAVKNKNGTAEQVVGDPEVETDSATEDSG